MNYAPVMEQSDWSVFYNHGTNIHTYIVKRNRDDCTINSHSAPAPLELCEEHIGEALMYISKWVDVQSLGVQCTYCYDAPIWNVMQTTIS